MEAKELMIGDIVSYNGAICRVTSTECFGNLVGIENETICELISDAELSPIPLTPEMLEANGLKYFATWRAWCYFSKGKNIMVTNDEDGFGVHSTQIRFHYVHELQHAIRLCGLTELADNFKV